MARSWAESLLAASLMIAVFLISGRSALDPDRSAGRVCLRGARLPVARPPPNGSPISRVATRTCAQCVHEAATRPEHG
jgi:hypothetical protein